MKITNKTGPKTEPCGTLQPTALLSDIIPPGSKLLSTAQLNPIQTKNPFTMGL